MKECPEITAVGEKSRAVTSSLARPSSAPRPGTAPTENSPPATNEIGLRGMVIEVGTSEISVEAIEAGREIGGRKGPKVREGKEGTEENKEQGTGAGAGLADSGIKEDIIRAGEEEGGVRESTKSKSPVSPSRGGTQGDRPLGQGSKSQVDSEELFSLEETSIITDNASASDK